MRLDLELRYARVVPHRDELEAAHGRIEALERELADARADADEARSRAESLERSATKAAPAAPSTSKKRRRKRGRAEPEDHAPSSPSYEGGWQQRRQYTIAVAILAACVYGSAAVACLVTSEELGRSGVLTIMGAVVAMAIGVGVLGSVFRAPEAFGGALITLLVSAIALGAIALGASGAIVGDLVQQGPARLAARVIASLLGTAAGVGIAAAWVPDAASSPIQAD